MNDPFDERFEPLLRDYLSAQLDGQLGKAEACFVGLAPDLPSASPSRRPSPRRGRLIAAVAATAASITAAVWCGVHVGRQPPQRQANGKIQTEAAEQVEPLPVQKFAADNSSGDAPSSDKSLSPREATSAEPVLVGQQLQWQTIDEGIVYLDPQTPVRKFRRQRLERVEWYDAARGARVQMIVPREEVQFVALTSS